MGTLESNSFLHYQQYADTLGLTTFLFRLSASHFLMLAPQKVTKEEGTQPSRPAAPFVVVK
jgi:hypothetical protein